MLLTLLERMHFQLIKDCKYFSRNGINRREHSTFCYMSINDKLPSMLGFVLVNDKWSVLRLIQSSLSVEKWFVSRSAPTNLIHPSIPALRSAATELDSANFSKAVTTV